MRIVVSVLFVFLAWWGAPDAQAQLRIVTYNTLFPEVDEMDIVLEALGDQAKAGFSKPIDILLMQEHNRSLSQTDEIVRKLNEIYGEGTYARGELLADHRDTSNNQVVVYRTDTVTLLEEVQVTTSSSSDFSTPPRATIRYKFQINGYGEESDFYVYNSHLRASDITANAEQRGVEVAEIRADADALGEGVRAIYVGDFNVYRSTEPALVNFTAEGYGQAFDPLDALGIAWRNELYRILHTQSPVTTDDSEGGQAGGGMDDRFDFQLLTAALLDGRGMSYMDDSYWAFGNTGTHLFKESLNSGGLLSFEALQALLPGYTVEEAEAVILALMAASDHLPVVADYQLPALMGAEVLAPNYERVIRGAEVTGSFLVANTAPVIVRHGADRLDYSFFGDGDVVVNGTGQAWALDGANIHQYSLLTDTAGARSGTVELRANSPQAGNAIFSGVTSLNVIDHAAPSFAAGSLQGALELDFGEFDLDSAPQSLLFSVHNLAGTLGPEWTARLDLTGWTFSGAAGIFEGTLANFSDLQAGSSLSFTLTMNTRQAGEFSGLYLLNLHDEALPGAIAHTLSISVFGVVADSSAPVALLTAAAGVQLVADGLIADATGVRKEGAGTVVVTGANTFQGSTRVEEGTLILASSTGAAGGSSTFFSVSAGAVLSLGAAGQMNDEAFLSLAGGNFDTGAFAETVDRVRLSGGGTLAGTGLLTARLYELNSGTVAGALGAGAVEIGGAVTLSGTLAADTLLVRAGAQLVLTADQRTATTTALTVNGGTFHLGAFTNQLGSLVLTNAGTISGTGTLTASSYALQGGTVLARLGAGAITAGAGVSTLSNNVDAESIAVSGGTLRLGGNGLLSGSAHVQVTGGTFDVQSHTNTVGTLTLGGGIVGGTGQLTASEYNLQGGTVAARLGAGAVNVSGTVQLASPGRLHADSSLNVVTGSVLGLAGHETVSAVQLHGGTINSSGTLTASAYALESGTLGASLTGSGALTKTGEGTVHLTKASTGFSGPVAVHDGVLRVGHNQALGSAVVEMFDGALLAGPGVSLINNSFTVGQLGTLVTNAFTPVTVAGWDFNGLSNFGPSPMAPTTLASGILVDGLTRAEGLTTPANAAGSVWGGAGWSFGDSLAQALQDDAYVYFSINVSEGFVLNLNNVDAYNIRLSGTGPTTGVWEYALDGGEFTSLTNPIVWGGNTTSTGNLQSSIALDTLTILQGLDGGSTVTFRLANYGATSTDGRWQFNNFRTGDDLRLLGEIATVVQGDDPPTGRGTLGSDVAGPVTFAGNVRINNSVDLTAAADGKVFFDGVLSGLGDVTKVGAGTVTLSGANTFVGGVRLYEGTLRLAHRSAAGLGEIVQTGGASVLEIDTSADIANDMSIYHVAFLQSGRLTGNLRLNNATFFVAGEETSTLSGVLTSEEGAPGGVTKTGAGRLVLTGDNTYIGPTDVRDGILELATVGGSAAGSTASLSVATGATLLLSQSNQVNNSATVSLSGGTITRGSGVSEVFGNLNLTGSGFLDFGAGDVGMLSFGTYTPSALLTVQNFFEGNTLTFGSNLTGSISDGGLFAFDNSFTSSWNEGTSTFTITAIPEPSTYAAAAGLLAMMLWPARRRLLKDAKKILGFTPPMRDRLAARSKP